MAFQWDERKRLRNIAKHGFDFLRADELFEGPHVIVPSGRGQSEERFLACRQSSRQVGNGRLHAPGRPPPDHLDEDRT